ncbi:hypothetical protein, partial [Streptomyces antibioticus]|uniref:hypothetical protein n=1 Tax=Streptomyces antibioticus TaxID=1890 RepID=UPI0033D82D81
SEWVVTDDAVYGRSPDGVYRWNGGTSWTQISGRGTADRIYGGGAGLLRVAPDGSGVYRYQGAGQDWERIGTAGAGSEWVVTDDAVYGRSPDGVYRWNGGTSWTQISERGTAEQIVPCKAPVTTNAEETASTPNQSLCATDTAFDLDDALSVIWDDPELTALQKVLAVQYLTNNWATTVGLEANACKGFADAYAAVVRGL